VHQLFCVIWPAVCQRHAKALVNISVIFVLSTFALFIAQSL
jgi:hypothetical protein